MSIDFQCSDCGATLRAKNEHVGRKTRCPNCNARNLIPEESFLAEEDEDLEKSVSAGRSKSARASKSSKSDSGRSSSSRPESTRRESSSRKRVSDADEFVQPSKRKKSSKKAEPAKSGGVPVWLIVIGIGLGGMLSFGTVAYVGMNFLSAINQKRPAAAGPAFVTAETNSKIAKFKMKWEMPAKWTQESGIEDGMWPWAQMSGQGLSIRIFSNRSLTEMSSTMTSVGGFTEMLKTAHTVRIEKLKMEYNDFEEGQLQIHEGPRGPVVWSQYQYKGLIGKAYGIRCTVPGPRLPCTLTMECSQALLEKKRPLLMHIAGSVHFVRLNKNGEEDINDVPDERPGKRNAAKDAEEEKDDDEKPNQEEMNEPAEES